MTLVGMFEVSSLAFYTMSTQPAHAILAHLFILNAVYNNPVLLGLRWKQQDLADDVLHTHNTSSEAVRVRGGLHRRRRVGPVARKVVHVRNDACGFTRAREYLRKEANDAVPT